MKYALLPTSVFVGLLAAPVIADEIVADDLLVQGNLCIGSSCVDGEIFSSTDMKIKSSLPEIRLVDVNAGDTTYTMSVDDGSAGIAKAYSIKNETSVEYPFVIEDGAGSNALWIKGADAIGLGTSLPMENLHISDPVDPGIAFERTTSGDYWKMSVNAFFFYLADDKNGTAPFAIGAGAPDNALIVANTGRVGIGTLSPTAPLEVETDDSFSFFRITATGATVNKSLDITFTDGPLGTGQMRYNIVEGAGPQTPEMTLDADGNMVLTGTLTTMGPTCAAGCDRVFDEGYALPSIEDHADQMFARGHLPAVGPTMADAPVNVTEKMGSMLNELEHAHIYINQLNTEMEHMRRAMAALHSEVAELRQ